MRTTIEVLTNPTKLVGDNGRYKQLGNVQLFPGNNGHDFIVATNGKACSWVAVERMTDTVLPGRLPIPPGIIPRRRTNRNIATVTDNTGKLTWHDKNKPDKTATVETEGKFPRTRSIVPTWQGETTLTIDAKLLLDLALAVNAVSGDDSSVITLDLSGIETHSEKPIPIVGDTGIGVVMPFATPAGHCQLANELFDRVKTDMVEE